MIEKVIHKGIKRKYFNDDFIYIFTDRKRTALCNPRITERLNHMWKYITCTHCLKRGGRFAHKTERRKF